MSNKLTDNGTLLTLGLVGAVAAVGAVRTRGSRSFSDFLPKAKAPVTRIQGPPASSLMAPGRGPDRSKLLTLGWGMTPSEEREGIYHDILSAWTPYADPAAIADGRLARLVQKSADDFFDGYGHIEHADEYEDLIHEWTWSQRKKYAKTHKWLQKPEKPMKITRQKGAAPAKKVSKKVEAVDRAELEASRAAFRDAMESSEMEMPPYSPIAVKIADLLGEDEVHETITYPMFLGDGAPAGSKEARRYAAAEAKLSKLVRKFGGSDEDLPQIYHDLTYILDPEG